MSNQPTIIILGSYRHCLTVARSLSRLGYRVIVDQHDKNSFFSKSHSICCVWNSPDIFADEDAYFTGLLRYLDQNQDIGILFPIGDCQTRLLARNIEDIPDRIKLVMPTPEIIMSCHDKLTMCKIADMLGVPQMPFAEASNYQELKQGACAVGYPCVIRPTNYNAKFFDEKAFICQSEQNLEKVSRDWSFNGDTCFVQKYASGVRHNLYFLAEKGRLHAGVEVQIIRTDRWDGTGLAVDSITVEPTAEMVAICKKWIEHFNYTGLGCIQYLVDADGRPETFLEINPRLGAAIAITFSSGVDFPKMAVQQILGTLGNPAGDMSNYKTGVRFGWLYGDIMGLKNAGKTLTARELTIWLIKLCHTFVRARSHPTWSLRDPLPTLSIFLHSAKQMTAKLLEFGK